MPEVQLTVELGEQRSYPIFIGSNLLTDASCFHPYIKGRQVCIVTNENIAPLYLQQLMNVLGSGYQVDTVVLPDGERYKSLEHVSLIYDLLLEKRHNRTTTLIALGGGVVGDMTGFAAATYQRGVKFLQIPTTLLSQVDSSVGGKTGVNHPAGKNMIGAFHQPEAVIIDTAVLKTLPQRELSAGIAEVVKYGLIADSQFYQWLEDHMGGLMALDPATVKEAIFKSCQCKADVVAKDERESGIRAILNLGHTFGHAIEAAKGYGNWLHGEAVAAGMVVALQLSIQLGWVDASELTRLKQLLESARLPTKLPADITPERFLELMALDKKVLDGNLRLVLLKAIGDALVTKEAPAEEVVLAIQACQS